jgi:hypothetical protein
MTSPIKGARVAIRPNVYVPSSLRLMCEKSVFNARLFKRAAMVKINRLINKIHQLLNDRQAVFLASCFC